MYTGSRNRAIIFPKDTNFPGDLLNQADGKMATAPMLVRFGLCSYVARCPALQKPPRVAFGYTARDVRPVTATGRLHKRARATRISAFAKSIHRRQQVGLGEAAQQSAKCSNHTGNQEKY